MKHGLFFSFVTYYCIGKICWKFNLALISFLQLDYRYYSIERSIDNIIILLLGIIMNCIFSKCFYPLRSKVRAGFDFPKTFSCFFVWGKEKAAIRIRGTLLVFQVRIIRCIAGMSAIGIVEIVYLKFFLIENIKVGLVVQMLLLLILWEQVYVYCLEKYYKATYDLYLESK